MAAKVRIWPSELYMAEVIENMGRFSAVLLALTVAYSGIYFWNSQTNNYGHCNGTLVTMAVGHICHNYRAGRFIGELCHRLCREPNPDVIIDSCPPGYGHLGKQFVTFSADLVMKCATVREPDCPAGTQADLRERIRESIDHTVGSGGFADDEIVSLAPWSKPSQSNLNETELRNLWLLVQQNEFVLSKLFETAQIYPKIRATCGHFYAEEKLITIVDWSYFVPGFRTWPEKLQLALDFHAFLTRFQLASPQLELCDVKYHHFGYNQAGRLLLLDGDSVHHRQTIDLSMEQISECRQDDDCHLFDCRGRCRAGTCYRDRDDSNVRRICRNIFFIYSFLMVDWGLFSSTMMFVPAITHHQIDLRERLSQLRRLCNHHQPQANDIGPKMETILAEMLSSVMN